MVNEAPINAPPRNFESIGNQADEGAGILADALESRSHLHLPGVRDRYRKKLETAISMSRRALEEATNNAVVAKALRALVQAHAHRAEDARYGAGQLSRGSQRAPTLEDCDDGWLRVEEIVGNAQESAKLAQRYAEQLNEPSALQWAQAAQAAAQAAQEILEERNNSYTFHSISGFSFGEGWYLAAAAALSDVLIQIRPDTDQAWQAERFVHDAGLGHLLTEYRSRPRSPKQLTTIIADAFCADPSAAQRKVQASFLGSSRPSPELVAWIDGQMGGVLSKKVLLWVRHCVHDAQRNTEFDELAQLASLVRSEGLTPIFFGDPIPATLASPGSVEMTLAWKLPLFQGADMRRAQLHLFEELKSRHGLVGQIGVTTAGMDGPALMGLRTQYLTQTSNVRMRKWVGAVPGYVEVVRKDGYLEVMRSVIKNWI